MKKILTASLVAMLAVTAANADIASTTYVDTAKAAAEKTATDLNAAMNTRVVALEGDNATNKTDISKLKADVESIGGANGSISTQIAAAVDALDVDTITVADGQYVKTVSETDGKISVTTGSLVGQINKNGDNKNVESTVAPTTKAVVGYVADELGAISGNVDTLASNLGTLGNRVNSAEADILSLETNSATKTELEQQNTNLTNAIATAKSAAISDAKSETTSQVDAAKNELQQKIDNVVAGGLTEKSVAGTALKDGTVSETQLSTSVNASLDLADTALQAADKAELEGEITTAQDAAEKHADDAIAGLDATVSATENNVITSITEEDGKLKSVVSAQITDAYIASNAAIAKSKLAGDVQSSLGKADSAMQLDSLKAVQSYADNGCATAGVVCSLVSNGGTIAWEKVVSQ